MPLQDIVPIIRKIMSKRNLTSEEAKNAMKIALQDKDGYYYLSFLTAMVTKGETSDELFGFYQAMNETATKIKTEIDSKNLIDLSGTGGAKLKIINVSTAASFVVAGSGVKVAKQAYFGVTSPTGSADVFSEFGIDVKQINPKQVIDGLKKVGIIPSYYQYFSPKLENRARLAHKLFVEQGLRFRTPFHLIAFAFNPVEEIKRRVYGIFDEKFLQILAELFQKAGYERGMTFYGLDGICEISNLGPTKIIEFSKRNLEDYTIQPEDLGIKKASFEDIKAVSREQNIVDFLKILYNKEKGPKKDIVLANAAAAFYVLEKVKSLKDGVELAKKILEEDKASKKLEELTDFMGDMNKLNSWKKNLIK
ncbi:MAG: anthranilate phosphoribosyltransferase [Candidatus Aenigmarchaeota archaeon]|nr:anthranilate phosphoribosyltransferase [Candidatus Aenigmarchaeota archaeon]